MVKPTPGACQHEIQRNCLLAVNRQILAVPKMLTQHRVAFGRRHPFPPARGEGVFGPKSRGGRGEEGRGRGAGAPG